MNLRAEEGFIGVDIAHAGDDPLVENQRFDRSRAVAQSPRQVVGREPAEAVPGRVCLRAGTVFCGGIDPAELALIGEAQGCPSSSQNTICSKRTGSASAGNDQSCRSCADARSGRCRRQDRSRGICRAAGCRRSDRSTGNSGGEELGIHRPEHARKVAETHTGNCLPDKNGQERAADCFDFREFGHVAGRIAGVPDVGEARTWRDRRMDDCIFCKIVRGEIPTTFVAENERAIAFDDIAPKTPVHTLVVPRSILRRCHEATDCRRDKCWPIVFSWQRSRASQGDRRKRIACGDNDRAGRRVSRGFAFAFPCPGRPQALSSGG